MKNSERYRKYSTKFYCPTCKRKDGFTQMLYLEPESNTLRCENHPNFVKKCSCRMGDMIILDMYPESEEEKEELVNSAEDYTENQEEKEVAEEFSEIEGFVKGFDF